MDIDIRISCSAHVSHFSFDCAQQFRNAQTMQNTDSFGHSLLSVENVCLSLPNSCYNPAHYCVFHGLVTSLDLCVSSE